jgi:Domain of unknown function (DUF4326)
MAEQAELDREFDRAVEALDRETRLSRWKILNARDVGTASTADRKYVGRPTKWGNPFIIGRHGDCKTVIAKHRAWIVQQPALMAALHELRAKHLVCWCAPDDCHAVMLRDLANP